MRPKPTVTALLALAALTPAAVGQVGNLVRNGSFESGETVRNTPWVVVSGDEIRGWVVTQGKVDHVEKDLVASHEKRCVDLAGGAAGGIAQTLATLQGRTYVVLFDLAAHPLATTASMRVQADGQYRDYKARGTNDKKNLGWNTHEFRFVAKQDNSSLLFTSLVGGNFGPTIDNVRCFEAPANPVKNGSFETPNLPTTAALLQTNDTRMSPWTVSAGSVYLYGKGAFAVPDGVQCVELYGNSRGTIRQTIATAPGVRYVLLFDMAGSPYQKTGRETKSARVTTGSLVRTHTFDVSGNSALDLGWEGRSQTFVATSASTLVELYNASPGTGEFAAFIDNVRAYPDVDPNLIANGDFEHYRKTGPIFAKSTDLAAWQIDSSIDITPSSGWQSASGNISIDLDGLNERGTIRCYFGAVPNRPYVLRFKMSANPDGPQRIAQGRVLTPDNQSRQLVYDSRAANRADMNYIEKVITFRPLGKNGVIVFDSLSATNSSYGIVIDDVRLAELDEGTFTAFGHSCSGAGSTPTLASSTEPRIGLSFDLRIAGCKAAFLPGFLVLGSRDSFGGLPLPFDLRPLTVKGCAIYVSGDVMLPFFVNKTQDFKLPLPNDAKLLGLEINLQSWIIDPAANLLAMVTSNAGLAVIGG